MVHGEAGHDEKEHVDDDQDYELDRERREAGDMETNVEGPAAEKEEGKVIDREKRSMFRRLSIICLLFKLSFADVTTYIDGNLSQTILLSRFKIKTIIVILSAKSLVTLLMTAFRHGANRVEIQIYCTAMALFWRNMPDQYKKSVILASTIRYFCDMLSKLYI